MLTALDFPEELVYAEHAVWVCDDGSSTVRIGLNCAATGRKGDVLHVRLPRPGSPVVRGRTVGHVEFEDGTFDIVAPVSGKIAAVNGELRGNPSLLRKAPFGEGFLFEVTGFRAEEVEGLMARDRAFVRYSLVDASAPLRAVMHFEADRPWPATMRASFGDSVFVAGQIVPTKSNEMFVPDWEFGDRWTIETTLRGVARRFVYVVEGDGRVARDEVTRVRISGQAGESGAASVGDLVLHFRKDDFTLAAIDLPAATGGGPAKRVMNPRGRDLWLRCGREDGLILDHPKLPIGITDEVRDLPGDTERKAVLSSKADEDLRAGLVPPVVSYVRFRGGLSRLELELKADLPKLEGGFERLECTQIWERGRPFWSEASRALDGRELVRAKLI